MKRIIIAVSVMAAAVCLSIPALAKTAESPDGIVSLELPNDNWEVIQDPAKWFVVSDGSNVITVDHYANGESLPDFTIADSHYVNVYQAVYSTQNEVFVVTGSIADADALAEIGQAIMSLQVLKRDTKQAVKRTSFSIADFKIVPLATDMYATSDVNVRMTCSTQATIIGVLFKGETVKVIGKVEYAGADLGWYQIDYLGTTAYVSSSFISEEAPAGVQAKDSGKTAHVLTGNVKIIYKNDGTGITVCEAYDGNWYDKEGNMYVWTTTYVFVNADGTATYSVNKPQDTALNAPVGSAFTVYWGNGSVAELTLFSDGYYYSRDWIGYVDNGNGTYSGADGTILYGFNPLQTVSGNASAEPAEEQTEAQTEKQTEAQTEKQTEETAKKVEQKVYELISQGTGDHVIVCAGGSAYYDKDGTEYNWYDDSTMMDFYGRIYDVVTY